MDTINVRKQDQILMSLVHYFVTKENYTPIYVQGVKDEIWLEKLDGPYRVIRINSNYIHNDEQFKFDQYKIKDILRQIKKKTMSFSVNALNINLNANDRVSDDGLKNIDNIKINSLNEIENNHIIQDIFPGIADNLYDDNNGIELILNITKDINAKTERDNKKFEKLFARKMPYVTYVLIALCVIMYFVSLIVASKSSFANALVLLGANNSSLLKIGQIYRLLTYAFLHGDLVHLLCNVYALLIIGTQVENRFGKIKYLIIYFLSAIGGGLLSAVFNDGISIGASGAIFGLLGAIVYFGFQYRLYFREVLRNNIIPLIILNLVISVMFSGIDLACHVGGLIAGYLAAMLVGITDSNQKKDRINAVILLLIFISFLVYLLFHN